MLRLLLDEVNADLRINLLGWITLRSDAEIVNEAMDLLDALETVSATSNVTEMGEEIMIDVVELCTVLLRAMNEEQIKENDIDSEAEEIYVENSLPGGLESKIDKLRMQWAVSEYQIVLEKLEMLDSWKNEVEETEVKEAILGWMIDNKETTLTEEGEDILDGIEVMEECGEVSGTLLLDITEVITALIIARKLDTDRIMPTFQQAGEQKFDRLKRIGRAESMAKVRDEMLKMKDSRKPEGLRRVVPEDFPDLEVRKVRRRDSSRKLGKRGWTQQTHRTPSFRIIVRRSRL